MNLIEFFRLKSITGLDISRVLLILGIFLILATVWVLWRYRVIQRFRSAGITLICFLPFFGRWKKCEIVETQKETALKNNYTPPEKSLEERKRAFMDFIMDLPEYMIDDGMVSSKIRGLYESGGARFQQVVLHDDADNEDVCVWVRKEGNYFIHDKGVYFFPWSNAKNVLHWDIQDCRPLSDRSKEAQWQNPLMNARYFWGVLNSNAMIREDGTQQNKLLMILIGIAILVSAYGAYQDYNNQKDLITLLSTIANNTNP